MIEAVNMAPLQVAPAGENMSRDEPKTKPMSANMNAVAALFNIQPLKYNTPTIVKEQVWSTYKAVCSWCKIGRRVATP